MDCGLPVVTPQGTFTAPSQVMSPFAPLHPKALDTQPAIPLTPKVLSSDTGATKMRSRRVAPRVNSHPYLFTLMTLTAMTELGLTAFLISAGNEVYIWASPGYYSLLILLCFEAVWTLLFSGAYVLWVVHGAVHVLANVASSVIWLLLTAVLWGTGAGLIHASHVDAKCPDPVTMSQCRQTATVEALGWTEFALCCLTLIATLWWLRTGWRKSFVKDSRTLV